MTTLTHRAQGPDKKAAEMSDSDEAGHANRANVTVAKADGTQAPAGPPSFADRRRQHAWVPGSLALLTALIGLSDILGIFRPDLAHRLHKITYLVPGTLTNVTRSADVLIGLTLLMLAHGLRRRKRRAWQAVAALLAFDIGIHFLHSQRILTTIVAHRDADRTALLPGRVLRGGRPAHPVAGLVGLRRPGRGGRRHRPGLHPVCPWAGGELLAGPAGAGSHHRPGRGVGTGSVGAGGPRRHVRHPHQRAGHLHPRWSPRTCSCARPSPGRGWAARTRPGSGNCWSSTGTGTRSATSRCATTRA